MNILVLMSLFEVVCGFTREQYWKKTKTKDACNLEASDSSTVSSASLIASLTSAMMENRNAVSYNHVSDIDTGNTAATMPLMPLQNIQHDVYTHDTVFKDCTEVNPTFCSGVYRVTPTPGTSFDVYCDMDTFGGPWTVMHNRESGDVDFYRNWADYEAGFGDLVGNFWLGLWKLHVLTSFPSSLRIELEAWDATTRYVEYSEFQIANESDKYRIFVQGFTGNTVDEIAGINGQQFTTLDRDNDQSSKNCAFTRHGAWWYKACGKANLNGGYSEDNGDIRVSMSWWEFFPDRQFVPMKTARMLVKRKP